MRIDFNVLWIEDQPERVEAQIQKITATMADEGFAFKPTLCRSLDDVRSKLSDAVFNDEVDLILVDWDLGEGVKGQEAISEIRGTIQYKSVVFYSAQTAPDKLREVVFAAGMEGIYCTQRELLVDEVVGVFESLVKKVLDLDHTRGIVMGATSDIDDMVLQCLRAVDLMLNENERSSVVKQSIETIQERLNEAAAGLAKISEDGKLATLVDTHHICNANDRLRILSRLLKLEVLREHKASRKSVVKYLNDVVPKRNNLGHRVLSPQGRPEGIALVNNGQLVTLDEMRDLRRQILALRDDFRLLLNALAG